MSLLQLHVLLSHCGKQLTQAALNDTLSARAGTRREASYP